MCLHGDWVQDGCLSVVLKGTRVRSLTLQWSSVCTIRASQPLSEPHIIPRGPRQFSTNWNFLLHQHNSFSPSFTVEFRFPVTCPTEHCHQHPSERRAVQQFSRCEGGRVENCLQRATAAGRNTDLNPSKLRFTQY